MFSLVPVLWDIDRPSYFRNECNVMACALHIHFAFLVSKRTLECENFIILEESAAFFSACHEDCIVQACILYVL